MKRRTILGHGSRIILMALLALLVAIALSLHRPGAASGDFPLRRKDFHLAAPQGFGDRQNSWTWSMEWWKGHLYVGTNRAWHCAELASLHRLAPGAVRYPPLDPDIECTADPEDLPLQAEIWRWTPTTNTWQRVYQSPNDVPLLSGKFAARDVGYRGMTVFEESDGTEALYVTGVSPGFVYSAANDFPPPRILRSTDGLNFEPIPQNPGTVLGDFPFGSFRSPVSYKGRLYVVGGIVQGSGVLLEAADPAGGNDNFRVVSPPGFEMIVSAVQTYNGFLYVGVRDIRNGYSVVKTDATGSPPYTYTPVVGPGGYLLGSVKNTEVLNMRVFNDRLYVGCNGLGVGSFGPSNAAELIRINPDDTWDLVAGYPRMTPDGPKLPISGLLAGFDNYFNGHMWRLEVFDGNLYVGTFDTSTVFKDIWFIEPYVRHLMGFDLYRTSNGTDFVPITTNGFYDKFNFGVRGLTATPYGLFLGTANYYYGLEVWQASVPPMDYRFYLPLILRSAAGDPLFSVSAVSSRAAPPSRLQSPSRVEAETADDTILVSWEPVVGASQYHIFRSEIKAISFRLEPNGESSTQNSAIAGGLAARNVSLAKPQEVQAPIPLRALEVGDTSALYFVDSTAKPDTRYIYYVEASDASGRRSGKSNIAAAPAVTPAATFTSLTAALDEMRYRGYLTSEGDQELTQTLATAWTLSTHLDLAGSARVLANLRERLEQEEQTLVTGWKAEDLSLLLGRLERRVRLAQAGILSPTGLE